MRGATFKLENKNKNPHCFSFFISSRNLSSHTHILDLHVQVFRSNSRGYMSPFSCSPKLDVVNVQPKKWPFIYSQPIANSGSGIRSAWFLSPSSIRTLELRVRPVFVFIKCTSKYSSRHAYTCAQVPEGKVHPLYFKYWLPTTLDNNYAAGIFEKGSRTICILLSLF